MKILKRILNVFACVFSAFLLICFAVVITAKVTGELPSIFGYSMVTLVSGSMEPTIPEGTYILIKSVDPETLEVGDVITFVSRDETINGSLNTHRITAVTQNESWISFTTKGDANSAEDATRVIETDVRGVYVKTLGFLNFAHIFLENPILMFLLLIVPSAVLVVLETRNLSAKLREARIEEEKAIIKAELERLDAEEKAESKEVGDEPTESDGGEDENGNN